jgi:hypothetical protein
VGCPVRTEVRQTCQGWLAQPSLARFTRCFRDLTPSQRSLPKRHCKRQASSIKIVSLDYKPLFVPTTHPCCRAQIPVDACQYAGTSAFHAKICRQTSMLACSSHTTSASDLVMLDQVYMGRICDIRLLYLANPSHGMIPQRANVAPYLY